MKGFFLPKHYFVTNGTGHGNTPLSSFDNTLIQAGISNINLVKLSSIVPPYCKLLEERPNIEAGSFIGAAYCYITSNIMGKIISSAIAIAHPRDKNYPSLIMEYYAEAPRSQVELIVRKMAEEGMKNRCKEIEDIVITSNEAVAVENLYVTSFTGVIEL